MEVGLVGLVALFFPMWQLMDHCQEWNLSIRISEAMMGEAMDAIPGHTYYMVEWIIYTLMRVYMRHGLGGIS